MHSAALVHSSVSIYGPSTLEASCLVEQQCVLGRPSQAAIQNALRLLDDDVSISFDLLYDKATVQGVAVGRGCVIRSSSVLYDDVSLGTGVELGHACVVRERAYVGAFSRVMSFTSIGSEVTIGRGCRIGGLLCNRARLGDYVTSLGYLVHEYHASVGGQIEMAPIVADGATIGRGAVVIGGVAVGQFACVGAGAVVVEDVAPCTVVAGNPARYVKQRDKREIETIRRRMVAGEWL